MRISVEKAMDGFNLSTGSVIKNTHKSLGHLSRNEALHLAKDIIAQCAGDILPFEMDYEWREAVTRDVIRAMVGYEGKDDGEK